MDNRDWQIFENTLSVNQVQPYLSILVKATAEKLMLIYNIDRDKKNLLELISEYLNKAKGKQDKDKEAIINEMKEDEAIKQVFPHIKNIVEEVITDDFLIEQITSMHDNEYKLTFSNLVGELLDMLYMKRRKTDMLGFYIYSIEAVKNILIANGFFDMIGKDQNELHNQALSLKIIDGRGNEDGDKKLKDIINKSYSIFNLETFLECPLIERKGVENRHIKYQIQYPKTIIKRLKALGMSDYVIMLIMTEHFKRYMLINDIKLNDLEITFKAFIKDLVDKYFDKNDKLYNEVVNVLFPLERETMFERLESKEERKLDHTYDEIMKSKGTDNDIATLEKAKEMTMKKILNMIKEGKTKDEIMAMLNNPALLDELLSGYDGCKEIDVPIIILDESRKINARFIEILEEFIKGIDFKQGIKEHSETIKYMLRTGGLYTHSKGYLTNSGIAAQTNGEIENISRDLLNLIKTYLTISNLHAKLLPKDFDKTEKFETGERANAYRMLILSIKTQLLIEIIPCTLRYMLSYEINKLTKKEKINEQKLKELSETIDMILQDATYYYRAIIRKRFDSDKNLEAIDIICKKPFTAIENYTGLILNQFIKKVSEKEKINLTYSESLRQRVQAVMSEYTLPGISAKKIATLYRNNKDIYRNGITP
ncbi:MAG: hypothetical protein QXP22_02680 [Candidatus Anstonellales archaeon]